MNKQITFQEIADQFSTKSDYDKFISQCENNYQLKVYRVNTMSRQQAINYYRDLKNKYQQNIYKSDPTGWHQNQRRLFIWLVICYIKLIGIKQLQKEHNWEILSQIFFNKDVRLLKYQYMNILKKTGRVTWTEQEDQILIQAYNKHQKKSQWNQIAKQLYFSGLSKQFKSPKHCRQRWNNHLNTQIKKDPWSDDEDLQMLNLVKQKGKKWSQIARLMKFKRTQHQIKNRFNSLINHAQKRQNQDQALKDLISSYNKTKQNSKFHFFNNIIVVPQQEKPTNRIMMKGSFQSNQQKRSSLTSGGLSFINCSRGKSGQFDKALQASIQQKLFGSIFLSQKSQAGWMQKSCLNLPSNHFFFQDSSNYQKRLGGDHCKLSQKGSFQKSSIAGSLQIFRLPKSDMSQQYGLLTSSNIDVKGPMNLQFSSNIEKI